MARDSAVASETQSEVPPLSCRRGDGGFELVRRLERFAHGELCDWPGVRELGVDLADWWAGWDPAETARQIDALAAAAELTAAAEVTLGDEVRTDLLLAAERAFCEGLLARVGTRLASVVHVGDDLSIQSADPEWFLYRAVGLLVDLVGGDETWPSTELGYVAVCERCTLVEVVGRKRSVCDRCAHRRRRPPHALLRADEPVQHGRRCEYCDAEFVSGSAKAMYCRPSHRKRAQLARASAAATAA